MDNNQSTDTKKAEKTKAYYPYVSLLLVLLSALGYFLFSHFVLDKKLAAKYAYVDTEKIATFHKDYKAYEEIKAEEENIQREIDEVENEIAKLKDMDLASSTFKDSLAITTSLVDFQVLNQLEEDMRLQKKKLYKDTLKDREKAIRECNDKYGYKIISIQLKLDNVDKMLLNNEEIIKLKGDYITLLAERKEEIAKINWEFDEKINKALIEFREKRIKELGLEEERLKNKLSDKVDKDEMAFLQNEASLSEMLDKTMELKAKVLELHFNLTNISAKKTDLYHKILKDIESHSTKIAIKDKYDLVITKNLENEYPLDGQKVLDKGKDITEEVLESLKNAGLIN